MFKGTFFLIERDHIRELFPFGNSPSPVLHDLLIFVVLRNGFEDLLHSLSATVMKSVISSIILLEEESDLLALLK